MNFALDDRTVLRGGYGLFFAFSPNDGVQQSEGYLHRFEYEITNDRRPDFTANQEGWFNGPKPTWDQALQRQVARRVSRTSAPRGWALRERVPRERVPVHVRGRARPVTRHRLHPRQPQRRLLPS